ncbi:flagella synthesis protein FlgN [Shewanella ulleungensis]|jgi:flagella synthesis protein FlgN|uniref:Flagellar protein FlgN n=1 Tax=Shewanella ulleungensis TaxID=2282699 RepID=A0ABQ2QH53_9GAMM|nr:flagellar protein FlgN [Shewanella ulleungensis]MCL1149818.1 flagellar protein FlgN [Shewanella ulleungensis]GGP81545.1 flagellar protein FlgN [Shewanella ulleungensis]
MTDLTVLLDAQHQTLTLLKQLIIEEKDALLKQDADKLLALAKDKMQRMSLLKATDEKLAAHPEAEKLASIPELAQKVESAKAILADCKHINTQNSSLIEHNIATINRLAQALQVSRNATSLTYNDKGKTSTISSLGNDFTA